MARDDEWYAPREIRFQRRQIPWLLEHLEMLREGRWPANPDPERLACGCNRQRTGRAPFETPCQVAGELDARLARLGVDRYLVEDRYCLDRSELLIAMRTGIELEDVYRRLRSAMAYVSGWRRKVYSYDDFKQHRRASEVTKTIANATLLIS